MRRRFRVDDDDMSPPRQLDDVDADWLTSVLGWHYPGAVVEKVSFTDVTYGSACRATMEIGYRTVGDGPVRPPESVLLKTSLSGEMITAGDMPAFWLPTMTALNRAEVGFYGGGTGAALLGDRIPQCWYAREDSGVTAILMEDLRRRRDLRFQTFDRPLDPNAMASMLEVLARLHSARWQDPDLIVNPLPDGLRFGMLDALLGEDNWAAQMDRPRGEHVPPGLRDRSRIAAAMSALNDVKRAEPVCLLHGDPHIGNMFFDADGGGLFDWQLFTSGHWAYDVVWSMVGAMSIEERRLNDRDLLRHYLDALARHRVEAPSFDDAWASYRTFAIAGFLNFLTPGDTVQTEEYNTEVGKRHATAAVDLDSLALLGV
jgi:aminoglycoside phosphotransferase (APT) family kinase protein